ncbi:MAG TPA: MEDS domain-containing protein [Mycobacteriales bacterium]|nr:MEDS domain-containing protein [Mycobacteriales bacterium]
MQSPDLAPSERVATLASGDHVCWSYTDEGLHGEILLRYFRAGLAASERLLYFGSSDEVAALLAGLEAAGVSAGSLLDSGQLVVGDVLLAYLPGGAFDPAARIDGFRAVARQAVAEGYAGIRVAAENAAVLASPAVQPHWYDYELRVELLLAAEPIVGMCCFNAQQCDARALEILDAVHAVQLAGRDAPGLGFYLHGRPDGGLALSGEVDLMAAAELEALLLGPAGRLDSLRIDVSDLTFIDVHGVRSLERVAARAAVHRGPVTLHGGRPFFRKVWPMVADPRAPIVLTDN